MQLNGQLAFGSEQVEYGHLGQAHTDGDTYVRFRNANVIAIGSVACKDAGRRLLPL